MAAGEAAAQELAGRLTADSINRELSKAGLPTATVLEAAKPAVSNNGTGVSNDGTGAVEEVKVVSGTSFFSTPVIVGGILGIVFLAGIVGCFCRWKCKNHSMASSHDESASHLSSPVKPAPTISGGGQPAVDSMSPAAPTVSSTLTFVEFGGSSFAGGQSSNGGFGGGGGGR